MNSLLGEENCEAHRDDLLRADYLRTHPSVDALPRQEPLASPRGGKASGFSPEPSRAGRKYGEPERQRAATLPAVAAAREANRIGPPPAARGASTPNQRRIGSRARKQRSSSGGSSASSAKGKAGCTVS